ncbi:MAG TPA: iron-sulfur cluster carrier protein ApbC [Marinagarivorans sp.]
MTVSSHPILPAAQLPPALAQTLSAVPVISQFECSVADVTVAASAADSTCHITLQMPCMLCDQQALLKESIEAALIADYATVHIEFQWLPIVPALTQGREPIAGVKQVIAVASGKGGVGKSTTSANLALALHALGARVGVLDADIYGPSQAVMLGVAGKRPEILPEKRMRAITSDYGVAVIGMGNLMTGDTPMAWRGPMATGALQQMLRQTEWPELDYLIIDMPPGTGDIQLTLAQSVPVSGSVIVTTPQDIALLDAKKGIELFRKVNIDVLGIVENMSMHTCSQCGHEEAIFGEEGGNTLAAQYATQVLGRLPLKLAIRKDADGGRPSVAADAHSPESLIYLELAKRTALQLFLNQRNAQFSAGGEAASPLISESDD